MFETSRTNDGIMSIRGHILHHVLRSQKVSVQIQIQNMSTNHIRSVVQKNNTVRNLSRNYTSTITNQCGRNHVLASCRSDVHQCLALQEQVLDQSSPKESKLAFDVDGVRVGNPP